MAEFKHFDIEGVQLFRQPLLDYGKPAFVGEFEKAAKVVVLDNQLSLAIGKEGQNARLAAKLTGWKIDIKSQSQMEESMGV